jgi:CubicO group peptidase (beta-lactamase class C family)
VLQLQRQSCIHTPIPRQSKKTKGRLYLCPRDQLKIGQVYLAGGVWNGKRVLGRQWVNESLQERTSFVSMGDFDPPIHGYGYG